MNINPYTKWPEYNPTPLDFNFLLRAKAYGDEQNEKATKAYDEAYALLNKVSAMPGEESKRNELLKPHVEGLKNWVDTYGDNPRAGIPELKSKIRDFNQEFNYGLLGAVHRNGLAYASQSAKLAEMDEKGYFEGQGNQAKYSLLASPATGFLSAGGTKEIGPGVYSNFSPSTPFKYTNLQDKILERVKDWEADEVPLEWVVGEGKDKKKITTRIVDVGRGYLLAGTQTVIPYEVVYQHAMNSFKSDPALRQQIGHMNLYNDYLLSTLPPEQRSYVKKGENGQPDEVIELTGQMLTDEALGSMAAFAAEKESYRKTDEKFLYDKLSAENRKAAKKRQEEQALENPLARAVGQVGAFGKTIADPTVISALVGGSNVDKGTGSFEFNASNRTMIFRPGMGETLDPEGELRNYSLISASAEMQKLMKKVKDASRYSNEDLALMFPEYLEDPTSPYNELTNPFVYKPRTSLMGTSEILFQPEGSTSFDISTPSQWFGEEKDTTPLYISGKTFDYSFDEFAARAVKLMPEYKQMVNTYRSQGIDLEDPETIKTARELALDPDENQKIQQTLAKKITDFKGAIKVRGNELVSANNRQAMANLTGEISAGQALAMFDGDQGDLEKSVELGYIQEGDYDKEGKPKTYYVNFYTPTTKPTGDATMGYLTSERSYKEFAEQQGNFIGQANDVEGLVRTASVSQDLFNTELKQRDYNGILKQFSEKINATSDPQQIKQGALEAVKGILVGYDNALSSGNYIETLKYKGYLSVAAAKAGFIVVE